MNWRSSFGVLMGGSYSFRSMLGAPDSWKLPICTPKAENGPIIWECNMPCKKCWPILPATLQQGRRGYGTLDYTKGPQP